MQRLAFADLAIDAEPWIGLIDGGCLALQAITDPEIGVLAAGLSQRGKKRHCRGGERALFDRCPPQHAPAGAEPPHPACLVLDGEAPRLQCPQQAKPGSASAPGRVSEGSQGGRADPRKCLQQVKSAADRGDTVIACRRGAAGLLTRSVAGVGARPPLSVGAASLGHGDTYEMISIETKRPLTSRIWHLGAWGDGSK